MLLKELFRVMESEKVMIISKTKTIECRSDELPEEYHHLLYGEVGNIFRSKVYDSIMITMEGISNEKDND